MSDHKQTTVPNAAGVNAVSPLSPHAAFVVQFRVGAVVAPGRFAGRIEHIPSGQAMRFQSLDELVTFLTRRLAEIARLPP